MFKTGNLFELAEMQLKREVKQHKRTTYKFTDVINYAIKIRKWLDKRGGNINGIFNNLVHTHKEIRRLIYLNTGR